MLHSLDRQACILLAFALSATTSALAANSSFLANGTAFNTITIPTSVSSATTLTTHGLTFTFLPSASVGAGKPTTIVQNGQTIVSSASLLIIPAPSSSSKSSSSSSQTLTNPPKNVTTPSIASTISSSSSAKANSSTIVSKSSGTSQVGRSTSLRSSGASSNSNGTSSVTKSGSQSTSKTSTETSSESASSSKGNSQSTSGSSNSKGATPSTSSTLPASTNSGATSSSLTSTSSVAPINQQPVISTLTSVVSGTTQLVPVIIGGVYTTPVPVATTAPPTTLVPTGTEASSSASVLSSKINVDVIPIINIWTDNPAKDKADDAIKAIKGILPPAENLLNSLGGSKNSSPCSGSTKRDLILVAKGLIPDPFKIAGDIIHSVACITNTLSKITNEIDKGVNAVKGVVTDVKDLTSLTETLNKEEKGEDDNSSEDSSKSDSKTSESKSSTSKSSSSSSSSSCTRSSVTQDIYVKCFPTTLSGSTSKVTQTCTTSTFTVSGCSITAFSTTTTSSGTANIATNVATITADPAFSGTIDSDHFSSRLASIEASGVDGSATGGGTITANATTSATSSSKASSKSAFPTATSSSTTGSKTSGQSTITSSAVSSTITACSIHTTVYPSSLQEMAGTGTISWCKCGNMQGNVGLATSGTKTTSFCGPTGVPSGWTRMDASTSSASKSSTTEKPDPPKTTTKPPPPPPYQTGTCSMHIHEKVYDGDSPLDMEAEIKDGGGKSLAKTTARPDWGKEVTLGKSDSKLPYDVVINFSTKSSSSKRSFLNENSAKFKRIGGGFEIPTPALDWSYEKRLVAVKAGDMSVDSSQTDDKKMPHMNVGKWDRNGAPPDRQMDVYWEC